MSALPWTSIYSNRETAHLFPNRFVNCSSALYPWLQERCILRIWPLERNQKLPQESQGCEVTRVL